jgi:hypothetical protein
VKASGQSEVHVVTTEFGPLVDVLRTGTPIAVLVTLVGYVWQGLYTHNRNKLQDAQQERTLALQDAQHNRTLALEREKFKHQKDLESQRFEYEKDRWREELGREMMIKLLDERVTAYADLWGLIEFASSSNKERDKATARHIAGEVREWRYGKGNLLAEDITRDAVYEFQKALWSYDPDYEPSYQKMRDARKLVLRSLRADLGLGKNVSGETIYEILAARQAIGQELDEKFPTDGERGF